MRTLAMLSASSLTYTAPRPWKTEPSRRMAHPLSARLECARIDCLERRLIDREPPQRAARSHHRSRCLRPDVALGVHAIAVGGDRFDPAHAGNGRQPPRKAGALRFRLRLRLH